MGLTDRTPVFDDHELLASIADALNKQRAQLSEMRRHIQYPPWDETFAGAPTASGQNTIQATKCFLDTVINNSGQTLNVGIYDGNVLKVTLPFTATVVAYTSLAIPINDTLNVNISVVSAAVYFAGRIRW